MSPSDRPSTSVDASSFHYVVGIDIGSQTCSACALKPDKSQVIKPMDFANAASGFAMVREQLEQLAVSPQQILIGLEAISRYGENLYHFLESRGYQMCLLLSGDARRGYVPTELIATYRELVRLHSQLADEAARYKHEIQVLLAVVFPEFGQVFSDPCRATALALLKRCPSAQAIATAGVETIAAKLHELAPRNYGKQTAHQLVRLAQHSVSSGLATSARSTSLKILCDQLEHTQQNLTQLEDEIEKLLKSDQGAKGLRSVPEFGQKTVAVLRAE